jgi:hypothetical protein
MNQIPHFRRPLTGTNLLVLTIFVVGLLSGSPAKADFISSTLGAAGPSHWSILTLTGASDIALNGPGTSNGAVGISHGTLALNGSAGPEVNGNVFLATGAAISGAASQVTGTVFTNQNLSQANTDAVNASTTFAALAPTLTVSGNQITGTLTLNGTAGINVLNISLLNLGNHEILTLNSIAGSQWIINDSGNFTLNSGRISLTGGVVNNDVVFNVTATGNAISASGGLNNESIVNGILLAPSSGIAFAPGLVNGEVIAGGSTVHFVSGASVIPEPSIFALLALGAAGMLTLRRRCKSGSKTIPALWVIGLVSCGLFGQQAQAAPVTGNITFTGTVSLDTASAGTATMVILNGWHGLAPGGLPQVQFGDGSFDTTPGHFVTPGDGVTFASPWSFNSGAIPNFWSVDGFTFDLTSSAIPPGMQTANAVAVNGIGTISGNGFDPTPGTWSFTTQNPAAEAQFSFSASGSAVPESSTVALLMTGALGLAGMHCLGRKRRVA